jgi:hypothetical protein
VHDLVGRKAAADVPSQQELARRQEEIYVAKDPACVFEEELAFGRDIRVARIPPQPFCASDGV